VLFDGKRATGVEFVQGGQTRQAMARAEVILAAGAIGSPQILQCSGMGAAGSAAGRGRAGAADLPGVGANLQDHLQVRLVFKTRERTLNDEVNSPLNKLWIGIQYMLSRTGPLTLAASQVAIFTRSGSRCDAARHPVPHAAAFR
jgi:choline dehydrogenase